jgi:predicted amidophosphoribosyltransferase
VKLIAVLVRLMSTPGPVYCSSCGASNTSGSSYCSTCGKPLNP